MTEKVLMNFSNVITVELPKDQKVTPFVNVDPRVIQQVLDLSFRGVTHRDGSWRINPQDWKIEKPSIGVYKITHNLGYDNCSLSVSLLVSPGSFTIKEHTPTYFIVETLLDKIPTDLDFSFSLSRVISQPVQQVDHST